MPSSAGSGPLDQVTITGLQDFHLSGWTQPGGQLVRGFPVTPEDTLLDIGCGDGGYAAFSARQGAAIILADLDEAKLQVAQSRLEAIPARSVQILVTDANPIPLPDASVTKVVAMEVLEHVDDPASFMAELVRVAKPGALFLLTVPDEVIEGVQRQIAPPSYFEKPNHIRVFKRGELEELAASAGLQIVDRLTYGFYHAVWWSLFWACENQSLSAPWHPLLENWAKTWSGLLAEPAGLRVKSALDEVMPKSCVVIARKP
jgi:2-polyprenyl-3-methyl-5-hydroxy-6-metoxy-1,4-benzoquinol methylase